MASIDTLIGVYHFLCDRAPRGLPVVSPKQRPENPLTQDGKALLVKQSAGNNINITLKELLIKIGGLQKLIHPGEKVFIKPNFNSPDPFPASTDLLFLQTVVELIQDIGAKITIGECSGGVWRPTHNTFRKLGLFNLAKRLGVELIAFEDRPHDWVRIKINGNYLESVVMPLSAYQADKIIYLPCLKTHGVAGYSGALKLAFGFVHPGERRSFHAGHLQNKLTEVSLCWQPDLIIMDGRKAFVTGGPTKGKVVEPGYILASADPVAVDVEGIKILNAYMENNNLPDNPWRHPQIIAALKLGLSNGEKSYTVIT